MIFCANPYGVFAYDETSMRPLSPGELNVLQLQQLQSMAQAPVNDAALRGMVNFRPYPDPPQRPLDERFADFKVRLSAALKRHGIPENPIPSVLKTKGATTAVQSCLPRSAVVANLFTSSRGRTEGRVDESVEARECTQRPHTTNPAQLKNDRPRADRVLGAGTDRRSSGTPVQEPANETQSSFNVDGRATTQAGIKPGPREALSDPVFFNAALHRETV